MKPSSAAWNTIWSIAAGSLRLARWGSLDASRRLFYPGERSRGTGHQMSSRVGVVTFPGSLDDRDAARAVRLAGAEPVRLWHGDHDLRDVDAVVLPGGFSYGDYLRAGAIARFAPIMEELVRAAEDGLPVLGICNGFQVLCESHLLPGALTRNTSLHFVCRDQRVRIDNAETAWTREYSTGQELVIPIKNIDGCFNVAADSVETARRSPDRAQPYAELGMQADEYDRIREILGRRPTSAELAIYSVMWSEHCSYKSSKVHLRQFATKAPRSDALLVGMGENAGVVDIGRGWAVTFKVESHNHPSYVEPYQGAATGVGGIVRDIISMGARPVAVMDSLRFGPADASDTRRVLPGVVAGIGGYGNCLGLPNIGGELVFDPCYAQNPLVNALCVGILRHTDIQRAAAPGPGNKVILYGSGTGPDGIGGASVLASATFDEESARKRPSVHVGDPFMEKLLIECSLELFREDLIVGIQDLGAAGVSCATTELAAAGTGGMRVALDDVPLRDPTLRPEEILMSESQERMMAVVEPDKVKRFLEVCAKWEVPATVIGEVTDTGRLVMTWRGEVIVDIPPGTAADEGPVYERPYEPPADLPRLQADGPGRLNRPRDADELRKTVLWLAASPNLADKSWLTSQYDRYVLGNTVLAMPEDAGVLRLDDTGE